MNIVIDSGSTKSSWAFIQDNLPNEIIELPGFNPVRQSFFEKETSEKVLKKINGTSIKNIFFYGAGVSQYNKTTVTKALSFIEGVKNVFIESDMTGAARSLCGNKPGIIGILGTGSNACFYDGTNIRSDIPSLGYILSDEGGGVHLGKELLKAYFYHQMPEYEKSIFESHWAITRDELIKYLYELNAGSKFIAKFAQFLGEVKSDWTDSIVSKVFDEFIQLRILVYPEKSGHEIHFVGTVAYMHKDILEACLKNYGLQAGLILRRPIEHLAEFHRNH
jgi:N-acetylglucosamine kinase-like BadF-type ATPase